MIDFSTWYENNFNLYCFFFDMQHQYQVIEKKRKAKRINTRNKKQAVAQGSTPPEEQIIFRKVTVKAACDFASDIALDYA